VLAQAATGDAILAEFAGPIEAQRATGTAATARHLASHFELRAGLSEQAAADILRTLTAPDIFERLVVSRNWPWEAYESWLADAMASSLLPSDLQTRHARRTGRPEDEPARQRAHLGPWSYPRGTESVSLLTAALRTHSSPKTNKNRETT
jgi:hypothetical protein